MDSAAILSDARLRLPEAQRLHGVLPGPAVAALIEMEIALMASPGAAPSLRLIRKASSIS